MNLRSALVLLAAGLSLLCAPTAAQAWDMHCEYDGLFCEGTADADTVTIHCYFSNGVTKVDASAFRGNDVMTGSCSKDTLRGNDGNDTIKGNGDNDFLYGGPGADDLTGGDGPDELHGDDGGDVLRGGPGADSFWGGDGDDVLYISGGDIANGAVNCGNGTDKTISESSLSAAEQTYLKNRGCERNVTQ